jgi:tRNA dimethylallyltransferase
MDAAGRDPGTDVPRSRGKALLQLTPPAPLVAVAGPTGAGKSGAALAIAAAWPAEVVNCDSLQLYRYLDIGTAKLTPAERAGVPHHLVDILNPAEVFTAGDYARRARPILRSIARSGRLPIVAGGTGFYLRALLEGLFPGPPGDAVLRRRLEARESRRPGLLHRFLRRFDPPSAARIHAHDRHKLLRATEVCLLSKRPLSEQHRQQRDALESFRVLKIILDPPRAALFERLDRRTVRMFDAGLVDEARSVLARGFPPESKPLGSLGYRQAMEYLAGRATLQEAIRSTQQETRRYAKRQWTWFRREAGAVWIPGFGQDPATQTEILRCVSSFLSEFRKSP